MNKALLKYGLHLDYCPCYIPEGEWKDNHHHAKTLDDFDISQIGGYFIWTLKCTCGYNEALGL